MNRKRLIIGAVIFVILMIAILIGIIFLVSRLKSQPQTYKRSLVTELVYCNASSLKPCIISFGIDTDGNMLINLLTPDVSYPDFYLTISNAEVENRYTCQPVDDFPTNIYCTGAEMYPGEVLQFRLISAEDETVLAEGKFAIIGLMLPNPGGEATATLSLTEVAIEPKKPTATPTATALVLEILTPIPTQPSYPGRSYP